jgi:hypothetical protein
MILLALFIVYIWQGFIWNLAFLFPGISTMGLNIIIISICFLHIWLVVCDVGIDITTTRGEKLPVSFIEASLNSSWNNDWSYYPVARPSLVDNSIEIVFVCNWTLNSISKSTNINTFIWRWNIFKKQKIIWCWYSSLIS